MKQLTTEQYNALPDCLVEQRNGIIATRKFVRRGRAWATIAIPMANGEYVFSSYSVSSVSIGGEKLSYYKYITNPKNPFPAKS